MSTKTVKLSVNLHEELKKIAEKEGFVLQDLIEEKLNELLEEKGAYHFQPTDVQFSPETQLFNLSLSPSQYQTLIVLLKRLCLNEKVNNITQMNMILDSVKKLELVYKKHEAIITESADNDLLNNEGFYRTMLHVLNNHAMLEMETKNEEAFDEINADDLLKSLEAHHLTKNMFEKRTEVETEKLLQIFDKNNYLGKMAEEFWKKLMEEDIKNGKCFSIKLNANDIEVSKLEGIVNTLKEYTMLDRELYFLYLKDDEMYFTGDFFKLLKRYALDIDINVVKMSVNIL